MQLQCDGIGWETGDKIEGMGTYGCWVGVVCIWVSIEIQAKLWCILQVMSGKEDWFGLILPKNEGCN